MHGQLGHGDPEDQLLPKSIHSLSSRNMVRAAAGYCHSLVLSELVSIVVLTDVCFELMFGKGEVGRKGEGEGEK